MTSVLLLVLTSVTWHVIAMAVRNQPNFVESQRPLKFVSKFLGVLLIYCDDPMQLLLACFFFEYTTCIAIDSMIAVLVMVCGFSYCHSQLLLMSRTPE